MIDGSSSLLQFHQPWQVSYQMKAHTNNNNGHFERYLSREHIALSQIKTVNIKFRKPTD